jgi:hypothetical protein
MPVTVFITLSQLARWAPPGIAEHCQAALTRRKNRQQVEGPVGEVVPFHAAPEKPSSEEEEGVVGRDG